MLFRALLILLSLVAISVVLTLAIGEKVLVALGLLLLQLQLLAKKLTVFEWPAFLIWLKTQTALFFRVELLKKWISTSVLPLILGSVMRRRIANWINAMRSGLATRYTAMIEWYQGLSGLEKVVTALIVLAATLVLSLSSAGLWLILFSVKLPFWIVALLATLGRSIWQTISKMTFRTVAFFKLGLIWAALQRGLPKKLLERKRRFEFRIARIVVRRRRMTIGDLRTRKETFALQWDVFREGLRQLFSRNRA